MSLKHEMKLLTYEVKRNVELVLHKCVDGQIIPKYSFCGEKAKNWVFSPLPSGVTSRGACNRLKARDWLL